MSYRILLLLTCTVFSFSALQAQCPIITGVTVTSVQSTGNCSYGLEIKTNVGSNDALSVSIGGDNVTESVNFECVNGALSSTLDVTVGVVCGTPISDLAIDYLGYENNANCLAISCHGLPQIFDTDDILNPLPVELTAFQANQERFHQVQLEWVTATEENNAMFSLEHSKDARNFTEITKVEGQGTSNVESYYSYTDKFPESGTNYYRLKQIDFDGTFSYSEIISIDIDKNTTKPLVVANSLGKNEVTLIFNETPKENTQLEVFNASGILFYQDRINPETAYLSLDISAYESGIYFVRVPLGKEYRIERFVKIGE